jgi:hypothetical protein
MDYSLDIYNNMAQMIIERINRKLKEDINNIYCDDYETMCGYIKKYLARNKLYTIDAVCEFVDNDIKVIESMKEHICRRNDNTRQKCHSIVFVVNEYICDYVGESFREEDFDENDENGDSLYPSINII